MMFSSSKLALGLLLCAPFVRADNTKPSLRGPNMHDPPKLELLDELGAMLGRSFRTDMDARIKRLEDALAPSFRALPKLENNKLGHATVRYALHRYFVQRHGWYVNGLDAHGKAWNTTSPTKVLAGHVGQHVQELFETRLCQGFNLRDTAILAGIIENLATEAVVRKLGDIYRGSGFSQQNTTLSDEAADEVMLTYVAMRILHPAGANLTKSFMRFLNRIIFEVEPDWESMIQFVRDTRKKLVPDSKSLTFGDAVRVVTEIESTWGTLLTRDCKRLKDHLIEVERPIGCVPVNKFYGKLVYEDVWQFSETIDYLRQQGLLDESNPQHPHVLVANYVISRGTCKATSSLYSICCLNECDDIFGRLEALVQSSHASPERIGEIVASMSSSSMPERVSRGGLSEHLLKLLDDVAKHHFGRVPIHGRLFAQWLHHAFPNECPFPHLGGTIQSMVPKFELSIPRIGGNANVSDAAVTSGDQIYVSMEEAEKLAKEDPTHYFGMTPQREERDSSRNNGKSFSETLAQGTCSRWDMDEELLVDPVRQKDPIRTHRAAGSFLAVV